MTQGVVGRIVLSDPATFPPGVVAPIMLELHADGTTSWRIIYPTQPKAIGNDKRTSK